eukprot:1901158-Pyramimonas_sp.AAC.1
MIDDVVDEQAYVSHTTGDLLVMLALAAGQSWKHIKRGSDRRIWDALASRVFAWWQNGINLYQEGGRNLR